MRHRSSVLVFCVTLAFVPAAISSASPVPVSPVGQAQMTCPTFSWSSSGDAGYQFVVYGVDATGQVGTTPLISHRLPAGTRAWTPSVGNCLEPGGSYAWSLRALGESPGTWSEPALFEVATAPSIDEVEAALATLRRYLRESRGKAGGRRDEASGTPRMRSALRAGTSGASSGKRGEDVPRDLVGTTGEPLVNTTAASAPSLAQASLTVSDQIHLSAGGNFFKEGGLFLWDDDSGNLGLGRSSLESVAGTATGNTAIGRGALASTTAGGTSTEGSNNTALGAFALTANTTGFANTATGFLALYSNTTGYGNSASGAFALFSNESGGKNTANGNSALFSNSSGGANTAIGYRALAANLSGFNNTAIGYAALYSNDGGDNTANGYRALFANTTGVRNTAAGAYALHDNETGYRNTAIGHSALESNTIGVHNTAVGDSALFFNTIGDRNVAVGFTAGFDAPAGVSDNIFIGSTGDASDSTPTIRIGEDGTQTRAFIAGIDSNTVSGSSVQVTSSGELGVASSSRRFKYEIDDLGGISDRLFELRPVTFRYRPELVAAAAGAEIGLIAEEVAEVFPELVTRDEEGDPFGVRYELLGVLLLHELQRQHAVIEEQGRVLEEMAALRERVETLARGGSTGDGGRKRSIVASGVCIEREPMSQPSRHGWMDLSEVARPGFHETDTQEMDP